MIQLVHRAHIQENKWHDLMVKYPGLNPYACLEYLDAVCKNWSAFVFNDYEAVLPICWNKKWGVKYIYQPPFLQQMNYVGVTLNQAALDRIKQIIYANFTFIDLKINIPISETTRKNYVLSLKENYDSISQNYSSQTKKNLKEKEKIEAVKSIAERFKNRKNQAEKTVPEIAFSWWGAPEKDIASDRFLTLAEADYIATPGKYHLELTSDDGARLWLNDQLLIDNWTAHEAVTDEVDIEIGAGLQHFRIEHFNQKGFSTLDFHWHPVH